MNNRSLFILLTIFKALRSEDCVLNLPTRENAWDKVLHRDLLRNYLTNQPPSNVTCVPVSVRASMRTFSLDEEKSIFTAVLRTRIEWRDQRLQWSPAAYGGLENIIIPSHAIWTPSLRLINSVSDHVHDQFNECRVKFNGIVTCSPRLTFKTFCSVNLRQWPYDMQRCVLEFGDDQFGVAKFSFFVSPFESEKGNDWALLVALKGATAQHMSRQSAVNKIYVFIYRRGYGLAVIIVVPSVILALLTLTSSLLNPKSLRRLGLLCFSLISHFVFLSAVNTFLPKQSVVTPVILLFITESTIVTVISILITHLLSAMMKRKSNVLEWVKFGKYVVFPRWTANLTSGKSNARNNEVWISLAKILRVINVVILVITYVVLYHNHIPRLGKANDWKIFR